MAFLDTSARIGTLALFHPTAVARLQAIGVDISVEYDRSIDDACAMRDIDPGYFLSDLLDDDREGAPGLDWSVVRPSKGSWDPTMFMTP
ncbi:MAG: hypothetical protein DRJ42_08310 [Deltaproteobacteria bacterium]|nr:MAG: hypothetical protein DRJ42_08310 [Deltaproteobacteria bacterium]